MGGVSVDSSDRVPLAVTLGLTAVIVATVGLPAWVWVPAVWLLAWFAGRELAAAAYERLNRWEP